MQLRHLDTVAQPAATEGDGVKMSKIMAVAWTPNNRKLAICTVRERESGGGGGGGKGEERAGRAFC